MLLLALLFLEFVEAFLDEVAVFQKLLVIGVDLEGGVEVAEGVGPGADGEAGLLLGEGAVALVVEGMAETAVGVALDGGVGAFEGLGKGADGGIELLQLMRGAAEAEGEGGLLPGAGAVFEAFTVELGGGFEVLLLEGGAGFPGFAGGGVRPVGDEAAEGGRSGGRGEAEQQRDGGGGRGRGNGERTLRGGAEEPGHDEAQDSQGKRPVKAFYRLGGGF